MSYPKNCPSCNCNLEGEDVYQYFLKIEKPAKAEEIAGHYGWTKENPCCFSKVIGIYSMERDMTTHWQCPDCDHRWERDLGFKDSGFRKCK